MKDERFMRDEGKPELVVVYHLHHLHGQTGPVGANDKQIYFFLKHFSGPESGILEFDWLLTCVPPVQFFPIRTGFVLVTEPRENH